MRKIVVNGVDGNFGSLVADYILKLVAKEELVFTASSLDKLQKYQEMGIKVAKANFNDPENLISVFDHADKVLLISMPFVGQKEELLIKMLLMPVKKLM